MYWKVINKIESNMYKGMAILMILIHNFMLSFPTPGHNEFTFDSNRFFDTFHLALNEPENIIRVSFVFFGHFGIQIFTFLSAYGLAKKYLFLKLSYRSFIQQRILKIYPSFILAVLAWFVIGGWATGELGFLGPIKLAYWHFENLMLKFLLLSNFIPDKATTPIGPWWFIPFVFQFYFIFPGLLYLYSIWKESILLVLSVISIMICMITQGDIGGVNIYYTILGHLPEFCLGIYLAKNDSALIRIPALLPLIAFSIFILGNIYEIFWHLSHISFLILLLALFGYLIPKVKSNDTITNILLFFGAISMPLFLVNGFLHGLFSRWVVNYHYGLLTLVSCLLFLMVSVLVALTILKIERHMIVLATNRLARF